MRWARAGRVAVALAVLAGACTTGDGGEVAPTPSASPTPVAVPSVPTIPGDRLAVIVPPGELVATAEGAALARAARGLAEDPPGGVTDVRVVEATSPAFVRDLAQLSADDGYDLVCIVGTGAADLALELARARRDTRFCTTDARVAGGPVNLVAVGVDPVALATAGAAALGRAAAPVGLLLSPQLGDPDVVIEAFTTAVPAPQQELPTPPSPDASPTSTPSPPVAAPQPAFATLVAGAGATAQRNAAQELAEAGPSRGLLLVTPGGAAAVAELTAPVVAVVDWVVDEEGQVPPNLLTGLRVDWAALLAAAVAAGLDLDAPQVQMLGDASVLDARPGPLPASAAATARAAAVLVPPEPEE